MNAKTKAAVIKHGGQLLAIFPHASKRDPVALCKRLRALEARGAALGLRLCNGPEFPNEDDVDGISDAILDEVDALLGFRQAGIPVFINLDPRGYALKIDHVWMRANPAVRLQSDWGDYGIIAPNLTSQEVAT